MTAPIVFSESDLDFLLLAKDASKAPPAKSILRNSGDRSALHTEVFRRVLSTPSIREGAPRCSQGPAATQLSDDPAGKLLSVAEIRAFAEGGANVKQAVNKVRKGARAKRLPSCSRTDSRKEYQ